MDRQTDPMNSADDAVEAFWQVARVRAGLNRLEVYTGATPLGALTPPTWAFGGRPEQSDALLALVVSGAKTATAAALWDYEAEGEPLPEVGTLSIIVDSRGRPGALVVVTDVVVVPFGEVSAEHAYAEGEGDRSLEHWRTVHERFFREFAAHDKGFARDMPVVCERFRVLHAA